MLSLLSALILTGSDSVDIRKFGAVGDGVTVCTRAIQRAIDEAGKGVVLVPAGRYLTGSLHLRSHVELRLAEGAVLLGSPRRHDYEKGVWYSLLIAKDLEDVAITGKGTIDGQGAEVAKDVLHMVETGEIKIPPKGWRPSETERPQIIEMSGCRNVRVKNVTLKNATCWVQTYHNCSGLTIEGVTVDSKSYWNNDGIDVVDCRNVRIANCDVDTGDDGICLKSDDPKSACENVTIENCRVRSSASAIKFGTASHGGFRHIRVRNIRIHDTFRSCLALESVDGGALEDVVVSNIKAVHTGNAFFIRLGHRTLSAPPGRVRHVVLRDFDVQIPAGRPDMGYPFKGPQFSEAHNLCPSSIVGLKQAPIEDVRLERIHVRFAGGGTPEIAKTTIAKVPERVKEYPEFTMFGELPSWALYARHVRGLKIADFSATLEKKDYRPPFALDDVRGLTATKVKIQGALGLPIPSNLRPTE
ncbi:glycoside hydrolase family 28 protein [Fimbriimonas ginsengisoli]|uniref:Glycoside hydrolase family 28 n=1 Tax=Fimbriimonas ginsengisoli Gsoil 348 TaxID=661478 RepID=A0A068NLG2_FIMGI|nr:glycoside hydrolase family 28 protein [Fimbriimonas ginsengisoli]AIE84321.1 glycoside hydrolase family 28 [Fimbriimonas ginsengisoli Gsoil 348]